MRFDGIHPLSIIDKNSRISNNVSIGPYSIIGPNVEIGEGCVIHNYVVIDGHTTIGKNNEIFPYCSIGASPQDSSYKNEPTRVEIGDNNILREYVSINRGSTKKSGVTQVGSGSLLMAYVHIGHDVVMGDFSVIANSVNFAGHVKVGDRVTVGGGTNISQFVSLGRGAYVGGGSAIDRDIPPFCTAVGNRIRLKGINIIGMRRLGISRGIISETVEFFRLMEASVLSPRSFVNHDDFTQKFCNNSIIQEISSSIKASEVGIAPFNN
jgi:UDP-N-acetylglucosamine acyltransferase